MKHRIPLTESRIAELKAEIERVGIGPYKMFTGRDDLPEGLTVNMINSWLDGRVGSADPALFAYVLQCYREAPRVIELTDAVRCQLRDHRERTAVGPAVLINAAPDLPDGLNKGMIESWLSGICGKVREDHLTYVMGLYEAWPDKGPDGRRRFPSSS